MKTPATDKARALKVKLEALAERGINGEKTSAQKKLKRLLTKYDFDAPQMRTSDQKNQTPHAAVA